MEIHASFQRTNTKKNMVYGTLYYARELTITSPYVHSGVDIYHNNPTLTLGQSRFHPQVRDFGFILSSPI